KINAEAKKKPAAVSSAAAVRLLTGGKHKPKGKSAAKKGALLKNRAQARGFRAWNGKQPGFCEIGAVSHDGWGPTRITPGRLQRPAQPCAGPESGFKE
ncbi:MAG: hypothetical protein LBH43_00560, partial [Treponema sp.]|nr:hypothetical protein [Treponema sp.]